MVSLIQDKPLQKLPESYDCLLDEAKKIIGSINSWKLDGVHVFTIENTEIAVSTTNTKIDGKHWGCRTSNLNELSSDRKDFYFSKLKKYLVGEFNTERNHTFYENQYIHELESFNIQSIKRTKNSFAYTAEIIYKLQFPLSKRIFHEFIYIVETSATEFYIISIPIDPSLYKGVRANQKFIEATYASIEHVSWKKEENFLEWSMCTSTTPSGFVPKFISDMSLKTVIYKDVPSIMKWEPSN